MTHAVSPAGGGATLPFLRERLLAVGTLALLAPMPLFFSNALELLVLLAYALALAIVLLRVRRGTIPRLPNAVLNVAAILYLPVVLLDVRFGSQTLLKTMLHLLLFTTVIKLAAIRRERDFSLVLVLSGMLFVASVSTSFHFAILLYVALMALLSWTVLVKWSLWRDLAAAPEEWTRDRAAQVLPGAGPLISSVAAAFVLAVPLFLFLPRLKAPVVRGSEAGREITTGFSDAVDPDVFGTLKRSDRVILRITSEVPLEETGAPALRIRTLALSRWDRGVWRLPEHSGARLPASRGGFVALGPKPGSGPTMTIDLTPIQSRSLPLPLPANGLRLSETSFRSLDRALVFLDSARNASLAFEPEATIEYSVTLSPAAVPDLARGPVEDGRLESPVLRAFAREALGRVDPAADPEGAAEALVRRFHTAPFRYELDFAPHGPNAVEDFLTVRRTGHCQTYATAMALLLREIGIPSRFVTGFLGGEVGALGRYVLVRGTNVHAWVEAWCGEEKGWVTFDPTPFAGQPKLERVPLTSRLRQVSDGIAFFYDRFVLSFGQNDQAEMLRRIRDVAGGALASVRGAGSLLSRAFAHAPGRSVAGVLLLAALLALAARRLRSRARFGTRGLPPASAAYRRLQKALFRRGAPLTPSSAPAETLLAASRFGPAAAAPAAAIVGAYVRESFGGFVASEEERAGLAEHLDRFRSALFKGQAAFS